MLSLGIDCAQLTHAFCLINETGQVLAEGSFPETHAGLSALRTQVEAYGTPQAVTLEASGNCWQNLYAELQSWGWPVGAVDPLRARRFAQLRAPRHKTDKADALSLAHLGLGEEKPSFPATAAETQAHALAQAIATRVRLVQQLHAVVVIANPALVTCGWNLAAPRSLAVLRQYPTTSSLRRARGLAQVRFGPRQRVGLQTAKLLQSASREALCGALYEAHVLQVLFLVTQIEAWNHEIARLEQELAARLPEAQRLVGIQGVGLRTALLVTACVPFSQLASAKQAAAYAGLHPHRFESNQRAWTRLSKHGDAVVRTALYRVALPASQHNPRFRSFYLRLREHGLTHNQALCAVAHKLMRVCYALMRDQSTFSLTYQPGVA